MSHVGSKEEEEVLWLSDVQRLGQGSHHSSLKGQGGGGVVSHEGGGAMTLLQNDDHRPHSKGRPQSKGLDRSRGQETRFEFHDDRLVRHDPRRKWEDPAHNNNGDIRLPSIGEKSHAVQAMENRDNMRHARHQTSQNISLALN